MRERQLPYPSELQPDRGARMAELTQRAPLSHPAGLNSSAPESRRREREIRGGRALSNMSWSCAFFQTARKKGEREEGEGKEEERRGWRCRGGGRGFGLIRGAPPGARLLGLRYAAVLGWAMPTGLHTNMESASHNGGRDATSTQRGKLCHLKTTAKRCKDRNNKE